MRFIPSRIRTWFTRVRHTCNKPIVFIDGDQPIPQVLKVYEKYVKKNTETYFIRMRDLNECEPKKLKKITRPNFHKIYLTGYSTGKEVVDKYIGAFIQKVMAEGCRDITVISNDYDFIDVFRMTVELTPKASEFKFRLIAPKAQGRLLNTPENLANIKIIKH